MSEDYTWDETITEHGYAVQNAGLKRANASLAARVRELERRLDAVPEYALYYGGCLLTAAEVVTWSFDEWYAKRQQPAASAQGDDPDGVLVMAGIDGEDSDL